MQLCCDFLSGPGLFAFLAQGCLHNTLGAMSVAQP